MSELANQTLSSEKTIRHYLNHYKIPLKTSDLKAPVRQRHFGVHWVDGQMKPKPGEDSAIKTMRNLHSQGYSIRKIAAALNELGVPCRKPGARWHIKTVFNCLKRSNLSPPAKGLDQGLVSRDLGMIAL